MPGNLEDANLSIYLIDKNPLRFLNNHKNYFPPGHGFQDKKIFFLSIETLFIIAILFADNSNFSLVQ